MCLKSGNTASSAAALQMFVSNRSDEMCLSTKNASLDLTFFSHSIERCAIIFDNSKTRGGCYMSSYKRRFEQKRNWLELKQEAGRKAP